MGDVDPRALLPLEPDERVLWQGRAAVGAPWPSFRWLGAALLLSALVSLLGPLALDHARPGALHGLGVTVVFAAVPLAFAAAVVALSKLVGPSYGTLSWLLVAGLPLASLWAEARAQAPGPLALTADPGVAVFCVGALGLPGVALVLDVLRRRSTVYLVTDRRVAQVHVAPWPGLEWVRVRFGGAHGDLRLERSWRAPEGYLAIGPPWYLRALHLRDDDPAAVLDLIRRERRPSA
ncbi:MAG: hypothetical protein M9894_27525 [Planctomycetes bacterium]|nr:hypothetical protein [Planctomycetota bacterium]